MKQLLCLSFGIIAFQFLSAQTQQTKNASKDCPQIASVEFSSNGLGGGSTLCNHPYDWDDYVNTFKATLTSGDPYSSFEYMVLDGNGYMVASGSISDFHDWNQYPLPASLEPGWYNFECRITGACGTTDWYEDGMVYSNCGAVTAKPVAVLPAQYKFGKVY